MSEKLESPNQFGHKGNPPAVEAKEPSGTLVSPSKSTNQKEANGHK